MSLSIFSILILVTLASCNTTGTGKETPTAPAGLRDLAVTEASTTADSVELTWSQPTDFGTTDGTKAATFGSYTVKVYEGADEGGSEVADLTLDPASLDESTVSVKVSGLRSGTEYTFKLVLSNGNDPPLASDSNIVSETTKGPTAPAGLRDLEVKEGSTTLDSVELTWSRPTGFGTTDGTTASLFGSYAVKVYEGADDGGSEVAGLTLDPASLDESTVSVKVSGLKPLTQYAFKLVLSNGNDSPLSSDSNVVSETTQDPMGRIWNEVSVDDDNWFSIRYRHAAVVFDNKLWVIGGYAGENLNDVWSSSDGESWTEETKVTEETEGVTTSRFSKRSDHAAAVFDGKLWVIGGYDGSTHYNDVWSSSDGKSWTEEVTEVTEETEETEGVTPPRFSKRYGHAVAVFDGKLWVIGGFDDTTHYNDVWSSSDGKSWTEETEGVTPPRFSKRYAHAAAVFDGKLWVIGGYDSTFAYKDDVWSSSDGKSWTEAPKGAAATTRFSGRYAHAAAVLDGKLWVIGGFGNGSIRFDEVWSSLDGKSWTEETKGVTSTRFSERNDHAVVVFNGKLWVVGGSDGSLKNDVWYSP